MSQNNPNPQADPRTPQKMPHRVLERKSSSNPAALSDSQSEGFFSMKTLKSWFSPLPDERKNQAAPTPASPLHKSAQTASNRGSANNNNEGEIFQVEEDSQDNPGPPLQTLAVDLKSRAVGAQTDLQFSPRSPDFQLSAIRGALQVTYFIETDISGETKNIIINGDEHKSPEKVSILSAIRDDFKNSKLKKSQSENPVSVKLSEVKVVATPPFDFVLKNISEFTTKQTSLSPDFSSLKTLYLERQKISNLSSSINALQSLTTLVLCNCGIKTLPSEISELTFLEELDLSNNALAVVPDLPTSLSKLNLSSNQLNRVVLLPLTGLIVLNISNNKFSELPKALPKLLKLKIFNANDNMIIRSHDQTTKKIKIPPSLTKCLLRNNRLKKFPGFMLENNIVELDFSQNSITQIADVGSLTHLKKLTILNLSQNSMTELPKLLTEPSALQNMNVAANKLAHVVTISNPNLKQLILDHNELKGIEFKKPESWEGPCDFQLEELRLGSNAISDWPDFSQLSALKILDLESNHLERITVDFLGTTEKPFLGELTYLNLSNNLLTECPPFFLNQDAPDRSLIEKFIEQQAKETSQVHTTLITTIRSSFDAPSKLSNNPEPKQAIFRSADMDKPESQPTKSETLKGRGEEPQSEDSKAEDPTSENSKQTGSQGEGAKSDMLNETVTPLPEDVTNEDITKPTVSLVETSKGEELAKDDDTKDNITGTKSITKDRQTKLVSSPEKVLAAPSQKLNPLKGTTSGSETPELSSPSLSKKTKRPKSSTGTDPECSLSSEERSDTEVNMKRTQSIIFDSHPSQIGTNRRAFLSKLETLDLSENSIPHVGFLHHLENLTLCNLNSSKINTFASSLPIKLTQIAIAGIVVNRARNIVQCSNSKENYIFSENPKKNIESSPVITLTIPMFVELSKFFLHPLIVFAFSYFSGYPTLRRAMVWNEAVLDMLWKSVGEVRRKREKPVQLPNSSGESQTTLNTQSNNNSNDNRANNETNDENNNNNNNSNDNHSSNESDNHDKNGDKNNNCLSEDVAQTKCSESSLNFAAVPERKTQEPLPVEMEEGEIPEEFLKRVFQSCFTPSETFTNLWKDIQSDSFKSLCNLATEKEFNTADFCSIRHLFKIFPLKAEEIRASFLKYCSTLILNGKRDVFFENVPLRDIEALCLVEKSAKVRGQFFTLLNLLGDQDFLHYGIYQGRRTTGLRILTFDGGGSKAIITCEMLRIVEELCGQPISESFDLIVGTSTGAVLSALLGYRGQSPVRTQDQYKELASTVFKIGRNSAVDPENQKGAREASAWEKLTNYTQMLSTGAFYSSKTLESVLSSTTSTLPLWEHCASERMKSIKLAFVSAITSQLPPQTHIWRTYDYPKDTPSRYFGNNTKPLHQALLASAAAPSYFEEVQFKDLNETHSDGGLTNNNPAAAALHEARRLWPNRPVDLILSLGTGEAGVQANAKTGTIAGLVLTLIKTTTNSAPIHNALEDCLGLLGEHNSCKTVYTRLNVSGEEFRMELDEIDSKKFAIAQEAVRRIFDTSEKDKQDLARVVSVLKEPRLPEEPLGK